MVALSDKSRTYLTRTTSMDQVNTCRVCLDQIHPTFKCTHISNPKTLVQPGNRNFYGWSIESTNNKAHRRRPLHNQRLRSPDGRPDIRRSPSPEQSDKHPFRRTRYSGLPGPHQDVRQEPRMDQMDKFWECKRGEPGMASSPLKSHLITGNPNLDDLLKATKPEVATISPADIKHAEDLEFDATDVFRIIQKEEFKSHMGVRTTSNILCTSICAFDRGVESNIIHTTFILLEWHTYICPIHKMSL